MSNLAVTSSSTATEFDALSKRVHALPDTGNPLTPIKAEALLELYRRQLEENDPLTVFTKGMLEGFLESQEPHFDSDTAVEELSIRMSEMAVKQMFGSAMRVNEDPDE